MSELASDTRLSPGDLCRRAAARSAGASADRADRGRRSAAQLRDRIVRAAPRSRWDRPHCTPSLTVANFSPAAQTLQLAITGDGKSVGHAQAHSEPGQIGAIEFPNLAPAGVYRAELAPADGFALDNVA